MQYHLTPVIFFWLLFSHSIVFDSLQPHRLQHAKLLCSSPPPGTCSNSSIELVMPSNHLVLVTVILTSVGKDVEIRYIYVLLVGMEIGTATMDNDMEVLHDKYRTTIQSVIPFLGIYPKGEKKLTQKIYVHLCSLQHYLQ